MAQRRCYGCMKEAAGDFCPHCGYPAGGRNKAHQLQPGTVLRGQYEVGRVLGQGGFGITYLGWDRALETEVCIKEYYPNHAVTRESSVTTEIHCHTEPATAAFAASKERFLREAKVLAQFRDVPEIVSIYGYFEENNTVYIVMEYIKGMDLARYIAHRGGRLTAEETFRLLKPVMGALAQVHRGELVHRDIAPDNIMLHPRGGAKLLDFGAARMVEGADVDKGLNRSTEAVVKHGFAPMEQYQSRGNLGPWTDVYAMCATIYYCLTGRIPPEATTRMMGEGDLDWSGAQGLTDRKRLALEKGMAVLARDRYGSMEELMDGLFGTGELPGRTEPVPKAARLPEADPKPQKKKSKAPLVIALCILAVGLAASLGLLAMGGYFGGAPETEPPVTEFPAAEPPETYAPPAETETVPTEAVEEIVYLPGGSHGIGVICGDSRYAERISSAIYDRMPPDGEYRIETHNVRDEKEIFQRIMDMAETGIQTVIWVADELQNQDVVNQVVHTAEACEVKLIVTLYDPEFKSGPGTMERSAWAAYVGIDPRMACREMGGLLMSLPGKGDRNGDGKVSYVFLGTEGEMTAEAAGYTAEAINIGGKRAELLVGYECDEGPDAGRYAMEDALSRFLNMEVVFCADERMLPDVITCMEAYGIDMHSGVTIICAGDSQYVREQMDLGNVAGSIVYTADMRIEKLMEVLAEALLDAPLEANYREPCRWLTPGGETEGPDAEAEAPAASDVIRGRVTANGLNIRSAPSIDSAPVGSYNKDDIIILLQIKTSSGMEWGLTQAGWVNMAYVDLLD